MMMQLSIAGSVWKTVDVPNPQPVMNINFMLPMTPPVSLKEPVPPDAQWVPKAVFVFERVDVRRYELKDIKGVRVDEIHVMLYQHRKETEDGSE